MLRRDDTELTPWSKEGNELTKMFPLDCPDLHVVLFTRLKVKIRSNAEDKEILINEVKSSFSGEAYNLHKKEDSKYKIDKLDSKLLGESSKL